MFVILCHVPPTLHANVTILFHQNSETIVSTQKVLVKCVLLSYIPEKFLQHFVPRNPVGYDYANMPSVKYVSEMLKYIECKHGPGKKNSPIHYVPKQDPIQDQDQDCRLPNSRWCYLKQVVNREWPSGCLDRPSTSWVMHMAQSMSLNRRVLKWS